MFKRPIRLVVLFCCSLALSTGVAIGGQIEKIKDQSLSEVLPLIYWMEEARTRSVFSVRVLGVRSMKTEDYAQCREVSPHCEFVQVMYVAYSHREDGEFGGVYKIPGACEWTFSRWISVPASDHDDAAVVFEAIRTLGKRETVRFAIDGDRGVTIDQKTYPSLVDVAPLTPSSIGDRGELELELEEKLQHHRLEAARKGVDGMTRFVFSAQENGTQGTRGEFELALEGYWKVAYLVSADLTGEKDNYSVIRLSKVTDLDRPWIGPKKDILINPWGAYVKDGPKYHGDK